MNNKNVERPVNLNLFTFRFPITAITSIFHRFSGIINIIFIGFLLWIIDLTLSSPDGFEQVNEFFRSFTGKIIIWFLGSVFAYHVFAGLRHFVMDFGYCKTFKYGKFTAYISWICSIATSLLLIYWLWESGVL